MDEKIQFVKGVFKMLFCLWKKFECVCACVFVINCDSTLYGPTLIGLLYLCTYKHMIAVCQCVYVHMHVDMW